LPVITCGLVTTGAGVELGVKSFTLGGPMGSPKTSSCGVARAIVGAAAAGAANVGFTLAVVGVGLDGAGAGVAVVRAGVGVVVHPAEVKY
jgi:hypothetical protein